jgi:hypothetical protein
MVDNYERKLILHSKRPQSLELPTLALDHVPGETAVQDRQQAIDQDQCHIMPGGVRRSYVRFYLLDATVANGFQRPENRDIVVLWVLAQVFQPLLGAVPISVISVIPQHRAALGPSAAESSRETSVPIGVWRTSTNSSSRSRDAA